MAESRAEMEYEANKNYMNRYSIKFYLDDSVAQYLKLRKENPWYETSPTSFLKEYFDSVHEGTHIMGREFSYISGTLYNRLCVIRLITCIYKRMLRQIDTLNAVNYHSLLLTVFPDFPLSVTQSAFDLSEKVALTFMEFVKFLKRSFCVGRYHYREKIISAQINSEIEEFSRASGNRSREDFLRYKAESGNDEAYLNSIKENNLSVELKRILVASEKDTTSSEESEGETGEKLPLSLSESKAEQNVSILEETGEYLFNRCAITDLTVEFQRLFRVTETDPTSSEKSAEETGGNKRSSNGKKNVRHFKKRDDYPFPVRRFPSDFGKDAKPLRVLCADPISPKEPSKRFDRKKPYSSSRTAATYEVKPPIERSPKQVEYKGREPFIAPVINLSLFPGEVKYVGVKPPGLPSGSKGTTGFRKKVNLPDKRDDGRISDPTNLDLGAKPKRISGSDLFSSEKPFKNVAKKFGLKDSFLFKQNAGPLDKWFEDHQAMVNTPRIIARFKETGEISSEEESLSSGKPDKGTGKKLPRSHSGARPKKK
ncbi:UPF0705 protein C11orf49 [Nephila pilipes]|uniref:Centriolar satellite-associated tubulin polyglutamylase complex regulator 1 n=1 Tax=Nephila pilipes TaxID=299642 RepID=A0A8X6MST3_NEPPI|nr:UPF0705 protein C11orf49 [Nephila pilipes]